MPDTTNSEPSDGDADAVDHDGPAEPVVAVDGTKYTPLSWDMVQAIMSGKIVAQLPEDFNGPGFSPTCPTLHRPGTPGKIHVLAARYQRRERLFHPRDAK